MKRILVSIVVLVTMIFASGNVFAQERTSDETEYPVERMAREWSQAFSKDGRQQWSSEFTLRCRLGIFTEGVMFTGGIRVDDKRTLGLFAGLEEIWDDATPANISSAKLGLTFRRYWHLGKRKRFAFYSDLYAGAGYIYKVTDPESYADKGDFLFVGGWQPGFRVRCYKNLHIFLGPTIATDCLGVHLGIGL
jgi:hypothetical protein